MREKAPSRERRESRPRRRRNNAVLTLTLLLIFAFLLLSMIGLFGQTVRRPFVGVFGFAGYAYFALALLSIVLRSLGLRKKRIRARTVAYALLLCAILILYIHILNSDSVFDASGSYKAYVHGCYDAGATTCGGVIFAWIAYPLLSVMGQYSVIPLAVLFFTVLFFALFPLMRGEVKEGKPAADTRRPVRKEKAPAKARKPLPPAPEKKAELRLFVDKVRPGQKDARKIKRVGFFGKKGQEPSFFDYRDDSPLYAQGGVIPEERPERFDLHSPSRAAAPKSFDIGIEEEYAPVRSIGESRVADRAPFAASDYSEEGDIGTLPVFVKRYASERAEANRRLYGEENLSDTLPAEPKYDRSEKKFSSIYGAEASKPHSEIPVSPSTSRPKARLGDLIQDVSDLNRFREKQESAPKRAPFIGEYPAAKEEAAVSAPRPISAEEVAPIPDLPRPIERTENVERAEEPPVIEEKPKDLFSYLDRSPVKKEEPIEHTTITPRESSFLTPKEEPRRAEPIPQPSPIQERILPKMPEPEEEEGSFRTRKPRSDLGGTHRTQNAVKPTDGFISPKKAEQMDIVQALKEVEEAPARPYTPPPVSLLREVPSVTDESDVEERAEMLVQALASYNITSEVVDHKTGPTFTRFAVTLPDNMSVNKLTPLEKDIKRKLKVDKNIRIIPSVPGLDAVGVEVPNKKTSMVGLRSIISAPEFSKEGKLYFAIGVDVSGKAVYGDLLKMPHLLVAGSTGSGKSVCLNVMICSIMYHYSPEVVRFIMVDPKKVELSVYKNMPHMLMPSTVTESDKAINALNWAVNEMERRYLLLMENGCRNIGEYNAKQAKTGGKKLYYIVIIVDEMADLMYAAKRDVEEKVNRITAKARAAGIHLVVATQRPSVDVITGTIKNNIPTRIAFKVTSFTDSKTILDKAGAEALFGNGDMLYMPPDGGDPLRLQGPYINNEEIEEIVSFVKEHNDTRFDGDAERIIQAEKEEPIEKPEGSEEDGDGEDEYFADALLYFIKIGQASISKLQIKYHIGYGRAARIVETMSERGYLGPTEAGNKSRSVNITLDQYYELYGEDGIDGDEV